MNHEQVWNDLRILSASGFPVTETITDNGGEMFIYNTEGLSIAATKWPDNYNVRIVLDLGSKVLLYHNDWKQAHVEEKVGLILARVHAKALEYKQTAVSTMFYDSVEKGRQQGEEIEGWLND